MLLVVIPARYASSRFPGKPLADIDGKTMIQRVYEQVVASNVADKIIIATDDHRIFNHVQTFGGTAMMTAPDHQSGTDRCAEIAKLFPEADYIINVQGDEPMIRPKQLRQLADLIKKGGRAFPIATLAKKITKVEVLLNPSVVKVVFSEKNTALFFSREPIPHIRGKIKETWLSSGLHFKHIGLYAYRRSTLLQLSNLTPSPLEQAESLEQLRWMENGFSIRVGETPYDTFGVDTPEDLAILVSKLS